MTLEIVHRHEKLAPESGVEFMAPICGAGFWSVCQGPNVRMLVVDLVFVIQRLCSRNDSSL